MASDDWTTTENDLIVADYLAMLALEISGQPFNKAEHNRNVRACLNDRSRGSVEMKHQNISAVLMGLGQPWIDGYKPLPRYQNALVEAVIRWLEAHAGWLMPDLQDGDGAGYDIFSFERDGRDRLIEVKTTNGWERTPFHISRDELAVADARRDNWHLVRLWNFAREPKAFSIRPPLDAHVTLTPTSFLASIPE